MVVTPLGAHMFREFFANVFGGGDVERQRIHANSLGGAFRLRDLDVAVWGAKMLRKGVYFVKTEAHPESVRKVFESLNPYDRVLVAKPFARPVRESSALEIDEDGVLLITEKAD